MERSESSFPKQGKFSVGVARQWCANKGKIDNCQVGAYLSYASSHGHTLADKRLFLPEVWTKNRKRRICEPKKSDGDGKKRVARR
ncbi:MAG: transposase [Candidatus Riflebacteria bacterium]|nr:transposase [Candidatus Riflebacteria bacterium]